MAFSPETLPQRIMVVDLAVKYRAYVVGTSFDRLGPSLRIHDRKADRPKMSVF
jgi:hypothetical protein